MRELKRTKVLWNVSLKTLCFLFCFLIFVSGIQAQKKKQVKNGSKPKPTAAKSSDKKQPAKKTPVVTWRMIYRDGFRAELPGIPQASKATNTTVYMLQVSKKYIIAITSSPWNGIMHKPSVSFNKSQEEAMICQPYSAKLGCELIFDKDLSDPSNRFYMFRDRIRLFTATEGQDIGYLYNIMTRKKFYSVMIQSFDPESAKIVTRFINSFKFEFEF